MTSKASPELTELLQNLRSRRDFLQLCARAAGYGAIATLLPACGSSSSSSGDDPPPVISPAARIPAATPEYTALKRTSFGPHRDTLAAINNLGIDAYLEQQLDHLAIDDGTLEDDIESLFPLTRQNAVQLLGGFPDNIFDVATQMIAAAQYRQMFSQRQLFEVMVEFWSDHFNIHLVNGLGPTLKPVDDRDVIRAHALGNFRDLLHASAKSPAMLFYLDNFFNQAGAPNENYARELMELHTLGVDGGYTEEDVKEVARCFTGWTIRFPDNPPYGDFIYVDAIHDNGAKTVLGNPIAANGMQSDGEQVLDLLAAHPSTAQFIATKLCRRFISDEPEAQTVDPVAAAFTASSGDIRTTLRALFATAAFGTSADRKFTRPSEYVAALVRSLAPDTGYPPDNGQFWFYAQNTLGQLPYYWPTPDGYPDRQSYWASTGGLLNRWRLSFLGFAGIIPGVDVIDVDYTAMLNGADTLVDVVDRIIAAVLMRPLSAADRRTILDWLQGELNVSETQTLPPQAPPELVSAYTAAVLVSSVYFQLR